MEIIYVKFQLNPSRIMDDTF